MATAQDASGSSARAPTDYTIHPTDPVASVGDGSSEGSARYTPAALLGLTVQRPTVGVCVVTVDGELDMLTAPLLSACVCEQLATSPKHLVLDLEPVRFLGSSGLTCLLQARELAFTTPGSHLHLAGLATRVLARPLKITGLLGLFDTYPTVGHALAAVVPSAGKPSADPSTTPPGVVDRGYFDDPAVPMAGSVAMAPVLAVVWCCSVGATWTLELRELSHDDALGMIVDWISSGVPVSQPVPHALTGELLAARGLQLFHTSVGPGTGSRHRIGYVCTDVELITPADPVPDDAVDAAGKS